MTTERELGNRSTQHGGVEMTEPKVTSNQSAECQEQKPTYERPQVVELGSVHGGEGAAQFCENGSANVLGCDDGGDGIPI
jgi:hypothetical protein